MLTDECCTIYKRKIFMERKLLYNQINKIESSPYDDNDSIVYAKLILNIFNNA